MAPTGMDGYQAAFWSGWRTTIQEGHEPGWPIIKEDEYNYWWALRESHRLKEMVWYIKIAQPSYTWKRGEAQTC